MTCAFGVGSRGTVLLIALGLAAVTVAVYWPVGSFEFVSFDDPDYVAENRNVQAGLTAAGLYWAWTTNETGNWHPLTWLSLMLDAELHGLDAGAFHLTNLLLHVANALLLFGMLRSATASSWRSALVAALFAIHPLHVESVAWVSERKEVLSTLLGLMAMGAWIRYARAGRRSSYATSLVLFALALMAKPMWVTLPFLLLLLDWWPLHRTGTTSPSRLALEKLPLLLLAAASSVVTLLVQREAMGSGAELSFGARAANAVVAAVRYLIQAAWPSDLSPFYSHPYLLGGTALAAWQIIASIVVLATVTLVVLMLRRSKPYAIVGWLWYLGMLVPVLGLVQVGLQARADRYTYVPLVGVFMVLAWSAEDLVRRFPRVRTPIVGLAIAVLLGLAVAARAQVSIWRDSNTLYARALTVAPRAFNMLDNAGIELVRQGRPAEAVELHRRAHAINPDRAQTNYNLAVALHSAGRPAEAIAYYEQAVTLEPGHVRAWTNLCGALRSTRELGRAIAAGRQALALDPDYAPAHNNLGNALRDAGDLGSAMSHYGEALRLDPGYVDAHVNLGLLEQALSQP